MKSFTFGANYKIAGKCDPHKLSYPGAWQRATGDFEDLAAHITAGHPWMPAIVEDGKPREQRYSNYAEILALDIDGGQTIDEALAHPLIDWVGLAIESTSSRVVAEKNPDGHEKFRIVFRLAEPLTDWKDIRVCNRYLAALWGSADPACKDASRFFYGGAGREPFILNHESRLPVDFLQKARAWDAELTRQWEEQQARKLAALPPIELDDQLELVKQALDYIPPYQPGSNTRAGLITMMGGVLHELGDVGERLLIDWDGGRGKWATSFDKEISSLRRGRPSGRIPSLGSLFHLAMGYGFKFPQRPRIEYGAPNPAEYQAYSAYQRILDEAEQAESTARFAESFWSKLDAIRKPKPKQRRERVAPIATPDRGVQTYTPGCIPEYQPGVMLPVYLFNEMRDRNQWAAELTSKGWKNALDQSGTGSGKSHYAGFLEADSFKVTLPEGEEGSGRPTISYFTEQSRNPSTETIEAHFTLVNVRNRGMIDTGKKTPHGHPVLKPVYDDSVPTQGNCRSAHLFIAAGQKGFNSEASSSNPICGNCPFNRPLEGEKGPQCANHEGEGFGFRKQYRDSMAHGLIRLNPQSAPAELTSNWVSVWEEFTQQYKPVVRVAKIDDFNREAAELQDSNLELYNRLYPIIKLVRAEIGDPSERWGVTTENLRESLKPTLDAISENERLAILERLYPILKPNLGDLMAVEQIDNSELGNKVRSLQGRIDTLQRKIGDRSGEMEQLKVKIGLSLVPELDSLDFYGAKSTKGQRKQIRRYWELKTKTEGNRSELAQLTAQLEVAAGEYKRAKAHGQEIKNSSRATARERLEDAPHQSLYEIIEMLFLPSAGLGNVRIGGGKITLTLPNQRIAQIVKDSRFNLFLDATANETVLCNQLGIEPTELVVGRLDKPKADNVTFFQVIGYGKNGSDRAESTTERLKLLRPGIKAHAENRLGCEIDNSDIVVADHLKFGEEIGYMSNSRGSNDFEGRTLLIKHGSPRPNMGAVQDAYATLINPSFSFEQYYQERCDSEFFQTDGRQRAERYPDKEFLIYVVTDETLPVDAEQIEAVKICLEAAPIGQRTAHSMIEAVKEAARQGWKLTQELVSTLTGKSQGYVSQWFGSRGGWRYWLGLLSGKTPEDVETYRAQLTEDENAMLDYLPIALEDAGESPEAILTAFDSVFQAFGADRFAKIWGGLPKAITRRFVAALLINEPVLGLTG